MFYDRIIIGAGIYGIYAALESAKNEQKRILVIEMDETPFMRATFVNQARVHMGYHYPRSLSTALKSANYFKRFNNDYEYCVNSEFDQIYATASNFSWTSAEQFKKFSDAADIPCVDIHSETYFKPGQCDGAFVTKEYTYDAQILKDRLYNEAQEKSNIDFRFSAEIVEIIMDKQAYQITMSDGQVFLSPFILNATYASVNQILELVGYEKFGIKYELCEIILCSVNENLKNTGLTVMDGPFFSIMPFGKTGLHSLTSVTFTPHLTSYEKLPKFSCQEKSEGYCTPKKLGNCNICLAKPESTWTYMSSLAKKFLRDDLEFCYVGSLFSMKPILIASEIDDSRPTVIRVHNENPKFISVLSGKINTIYDLDEVLKYD